METIKSIVATIMFQDIVAVLSLFTAVIGGGFALYQWRIGIKQKRAETVEKLIKIVRDDMDIATIMDNVDWNEGFVYVDDKFYIKDTTSRDSLKSISHEDLFKMIDRTLAHFSYICYLKNQRIITSKDMRNFEYGIHSLADNEHIAMYLYKLYWKSKSLNVSMSYSYLFDYCIKKGYLPKLLKKREILGAK